MRAITNSILAFVVGVLILFALSEDADAVGGQFAHIDSYQVTCGTSATIIRAPSGDQHSFRCQNTSTTVVAFGDVNLTTSAHGGTACATNCPSQFFGANVNHAYCRVASGTVALSCSGIVSRPAELIEMFDGGQVDGE